MLFRNDLRRRKDMAVAERVRDGEAVELENLRETDVDPRGGGGPPIAGPEVSDGENSGGGVDSGLLPSPQPEPRPPRRRPWPWPTPRPTPVPRRPIDANMYATKKTVAQGMMDLALISANANQLRYVLESKSSNMYFYVNIFFITLSIILQLIVGIGLIMLGRYNLNRGSEGAKADKMNNFLVLGIFLITIVNVFISAFGIEEAEVITVSPATTM